MRIVITTSLLLLMSLASCKSEYDERMEQALELKEKIVLVERSNNLAPRKSLITEIEMLNEEIQFLAKISGNEELFLQELFNE